MPDSSPIFILRSKGTVLGTVHDWSEDWPWYRGRFQPSDAFSNYAPIFAEAERATNSKDSGLQDRCMRQIVALELQLIHQDNGELAGEPDIVWIRGDRVHWRGHHGILRGVV